MAESKGQKRNVNWSEGEVSALIAVWRENLSALRAQKRNRPIYEKMSVQLKEANVHRSPNDIQMKIRNLTKDYRKEKADQLRMTEEIVESLVLSTVEGHTEAGTSTQTCSPVPDDPEGETEASPLERSMTLSRRQRKRKTPTQVDLVKQFSEMNAQGREQQAEARMFDQALMSVLQKQSNTQDNLVQVLQRIARSIEEK